MKRFVLACLVAFATPALRAQTDSAAHDHLVPDVRIAEGIYLKFDDLKNQHPTPRERIVTSEDPKAFDFFERVLSAEELSVYDELGNLVPTPVNQIWGYANRGVLYINVEGEFNRIPILGAICHFVAKKTTVHETNVNPTNMYQRNSYYNNYYNGPTAKYTTSEMVQFILLLDSGEVMEYTAESVGIALMRDPELHDEYEALSDRKKEKKKFYYIRQFNKRNPLSLPVN